MFHYRMLEPRPSEDHSLRVVILTSYQEEGMRRLEELVARVEHWALCVMVRHTGFVCCTDCCVTLGKLFDFSEPQSCSCR